MHIFLHRFLFIGVVAVMTVLISASANGSQIGLSPNSGETGHVYLPVMSNLYDATLPPPIFGVQMYGVSDDSSPFHAPLLATGTTWMRAPLPWKNIQLENTNPPTYYWFHTDRNLAAAAEEYGGLSLIATVGEAPSWAAPSPDSPIYPAYLDQFADFVVAAVERYDGDGFQDAPGSPRILHWEFYNEPDATGNSHLARWGDEGAAYAQMLQTVYPRVKAANPNAQVVFGGIAYDYFEDQGGPFVREFVDDVMSAGGGDYFDVFNFHAYPSFASNWAVSGPGLLEKTEFLRAKLASYGHGDKPFVVTESGWHSDNNVVFPSSEEEQARYVLALFVQSYAADIDAMIWWTLFDPGYPYWENGLLTNENPPLEKLSMAAFQTAVERLSQAHFVRRLTTPETGNALMEVYKFENIPNDRAIYVVWMNPIDGGNTAPLTLARPQIRRCGLYGNCIIVNDTDDGVADGQVTVSVGSKPFYLEVDR